MLAFKRRIMVIIRPSPAVLVYLFQRMKILTAISLLSLAVLPACSTTTQTTSTRQTLEQKLSAKYAGTQAMGQEPAPPAEGPEDVPADAPNNVDKNPTLMPSPLLRYWAASRTP